MLPMSEYDSYLTFIYNYRFCTQDYFLARIGPYNYIILWLYLCMKIFKYDTYYTEVKPV